jgi:antitoxin component YwqK of YwqJK toxin-antitoxin module
MKRIVSIAFMMLSLVVVCQAVEHRVVKYANGVTRYEGDFQDGKPIGEVKRYHENGRLSCVQTFDEEGNSQVIFYAGSGDLLAKGQYVGKHREGEWKFYGEGEYLFMVEHYDRGMRVGETLIYNKVGKVMQRVPYVDGKIDGERIHYYPYGNVLANYSYKQGVLDGPYSYFYETGQLNEEGSYLNGKPHGIWRSYAEDGTFEEVEFIEGKPAHPEEYNKAFQEKLDRYEIDTNIKDPQDYINNPIDYFAL